MFNIMKWSKALKQNQKGFTLVELMVVVVIIGILVAIAVPIYGGIQERAAQNAHDANARTLQGAASIWFAEEPGDAGGVTGITTENTGTMKGLATYVNEPYPVVPEIIRDDGEMKGAVYYTIAIETTGSVTVTPRIGAYND